MDTKKYGGKMRVSPELLLELLHLKGELVGIEYDPLSGTIGIYVKGDAEHYPEVQQGYMSPELFVEATAQPMLNIKDRKIVAVDVVDPRDGKHYPHFRFRKEEHLNGKEDNKEKNSEEGKPVGVNNGYKRNFCENHPAGECPRKEGDCEGCRFKQFLCPYNGKYICKLLPEKRGGLECLDCEILKRRGEEGR